MGRTGRMVYVRLVITIALMALATWILYRLGRGQGWWGQHELATAGGGQTAAKHRAVKAQPSLSTATARREPDSLASQVWSAVLKHRSGVWLYTRENRMLRITLVGNVALPEAVLYVERVDSETYTGRIKSGSAVVQLFTLRRGEQPVYQSVTVEAGGPPDFELGFAHEVVATEAITGLTPTDDTLRKLATDIGFGEAIDDVQ